MRAAYRRMILAHRPRMEALARGRPEPGRSVLAWDDARRCAAATRMAHSLLRRRTSATENAPAVRRTPQRRRQPASRVSHEALFRARMAHGPQRLAPSRRDRCITSAHAAHSVSRVELAMRRRAPVDDERAPSMIPSANDGDEARQRATRLAHHRSLMAHDASLLALDRSRRSTVSREHAPGARDGAPDEARSCHGWRHARTAPGQGGPPCHAACRGFSGKLARPGTSEARESSVSSSEAPLAAATRGD